MTTENHNNAPEFQLSAQERFDATLGKLEQQIHSADRVAALQAAINMMHLEADVKRLQTPQGLSMTFAQLSDVTQQTLMAYVKDIEQFKNHVATVDVQKLTMEEFFSLVNEGKSAGLPYLPYTPESFLAHLLHKTSQALMETATQALLQSPEAQQLIEQEKQVDADALQKLERLKEEGRKKL